MFTVSFYIVLSYRNLSVWSVGRYTSRRIGTRRCQVTDNNIVATISIVNQVAQRQHRSVIIYIL